MAAAQAGDARALAAVLDRYRDPVIGFLQKRIEDPGRAEDLWYVVLTRVYHHLHDFDCSRLFRKWVYQIATRLALNEIRDRQRHREIPFAHLTRQRHSPNPIPFDPADPRPGVDNEIDREAQNRAVRSTLAAIPDHQRGPLEMCVWEELSYEEIAARTGLNLGTVKSRLHRARKCFAKAFRRNHPHHL